jgi:hypothetical protein
VTVTFKTGNFMPVHDWTRVDAGIFHDFHQGWIIAIRNALNSGLLPSDFYALVEQVADGPIPDVLTLERIEEDVGSGTSPDAVAGGRSAGVTVADHPPRVKHTHAAERDTYAARASRVAMFHVSGDRVVGFIEIVSPGNKHSEIAVQSFNNKLAEAMRRGCHLMVIDVHPPTPRDPQGMHVRFWQDNFGETDVPGVTQQQPLGMAAYRCDLAPTAYFEPLAVGGVLIDMPAFLTPDMYVNVPLEATYLDAWRGVPDRWKRVIEANQ